MDILSIFADKLKELMNYSEITEKDLSAAVGTDVSQIRRYLRTVPEVESAKDEHADRGGAGITIVTFKMD